MKRGRGNSRYFYINPLKREAEAELKRKVAKTSNMSQTILKISFASKPTQNITVDFIKAIFQKFGKISKIKIQKKNLEDLTIFVEFDNAAGANSAYYMNGKFILNNSCQLNVKYAPKDLKMMIDRNDEYNWDFTKRMNINSVNSSYSQTMAPVETFSGYQNYMEHYQSNGSTVDQQYNPLYPEFNRYPILSFCPQPTASVLVKNVDYKIFNTCCMFNLFCLYGNVIEVKLLNFENSAIVTMDGVEGASRCINYLNGLRIGMITQLQVGYAHPNMMISCNSLFLLADGSLNYSNFKQSRLNRFNTYNNYTKMNFSAPRNTLYFYNAPSDCDKTMIIDVFNSNGINLEDVVIFRRQTRPFSAGLLQFPSVEEAVLAIVFCNHFDMLSQGHPHPFTLKLNFTDRVIYRNQRYIY